ncbi:unnamed protein product [Tilletia laevis]|nr:unnamed protein product [Tilletia laevis]CAD6967448.1 unnamed protein product [Tilletia controversa]CAD7063210.1 unnamed protein product [Tilletia caries]
MALKRPCWELTPSPCPSATGQVKIASNMLVLLERFRLAFGGSRGDARPAGRRNRGHRPVWNRYPLGTTAQFLGSQVENAMVAAETIRVEARQDRSDDLPAISICERAGREQAALAVPDRTNLIQPSMNGGLVAEHVHFASAVSFHTQSGEIGNRSVNRMVLVCGAYTINAVKTLSMIRT